MSAVSHPEFARLLGALGPYLDDLVFVGGWAHRLMAAHELARLLPFEPLMTLDADLAGEGQLPIRGADIRTRLKMAGFAEELRGEDKPPISEFHLGEEGGGLYVEFLVPQRGSGRRRGGVPDDTAVFGGTTAQKLRYVDLLLAEPWRLDVEPAGGVAVPIRIANPASFIAQKLLTLEKRRPEKRPKDLLYIHDTIQLFSASLAEPAEWRRVTSERTDNLTEQVRLRAATTFDGKSDLLRKSARVARDTGRPNPPAAEEIAQLCTAGLGEIF